MLRINGILLTNAGCTIQSPSFLGLPSPSSMLRDHRVFPGGSFPQRSSFPDGYDLCASLPPMKDGNMTAYAGVTGSGSLAASMQSARNAAANLTGSGGISEAQLGLLVNLALTMTGSSTMTAAIQGTVNLAANLVGAGDIDAALGLLVSMAAEIGGTGEVSDTSNLNGFCNLAANITSQGELVTAESCAAAVVSKVIGGGTATVESALLAAGSAGDPWTGIIEGMTAGEMMALIRSLVAELHKLNGLDAAVPVTHTPGSITAGGISIDLGGDNVNSRTKTRRSA